MSDIPAWVHEEIDNEHERQSNREKMRHGTRMMELAENNIQKHAIADEAYSFFAARYTGKRAEYWWQSFFTHVAIEHISGIGYSLDEHYERVCEAAARQGDLAQESEDT
jgi:hypothetical protein